MASRRILPTAVALLCWVAGAPAALADASFDPNINAGVSGTGDTPILPIALVVVVGLALALLAWTRGASAVFALIATLAGLALGGFFIVAGLFGDFGGRHEIFPIPIAIGVAILAAVLFVVWRTRRRVRPALDR